MSGAERRARELARIHVGAKLLGMDQATYRDMLETTAGVRSAADLDFQGRQKVIRRLHELGMPPPPRARGRPANMDKLSGEIAKIEAQLADMGLSWAYADAIGRRMFGVPRVAWLRKQEQLVAVLAALHVEQQKRHLGAGIDQAATQAGMSAGQLDAFVRSRGAPAGWRRNVGWLEQVADWLAGAMDGHGAGTGPGEARD